MSVIAAVAAEQPKPTTPYVPVSTVSGQVFRMHEEGGVPARVDRSYLSGMSGGYQSQVIAAMRALRLLNQNGEPTQTLVNLVEDPERFGNFLKNEVTRLYPEMIGLAQTRGTQQQLEIAFREKFGITGSTLRSAIKFYLDASELTGLPVSPQFKVPAVKKATGTKPQRQLPSKNTSTKVAAQTPDDQQITSPANTHNVRIESGGSVILTVQVDLFSLSKRDREFVFSLVDQVKNYASRESLDASDGVSGKAADQKTTIPSFVRRSV